MAVSNCIFLDPILAADLEVDISFSSSTYYDASASTGIWNIVDGQAQAAVAPAGTAGLEVDFGDGSDGAFSDGSSLAAFSTSGTTITVNTDVQSTFQFTSFSLSSGITLNVTGSNPLTLKVLGTTVVNGTISANGSTGSANGTGTGVGQSDAGEPAGGSGVAGGGDGGAGANSAGTTAAVNGSPSSTAANYPRGGTAGANVAGLAVDQGGGGACTGSGATDGDNNVGSGNTCGGDTQATAAGALETFFSGGGGGGGGGACTGGACTGVVPGAGGGGGGGGLHIASLGNLSIDGTISSTGGTGGSNLAMEGGGVSCGGGGGGGSGGMIWLQTLKTLSTPGASGAIDVSGGTGGNGCGGSFRGGNGSRGVYHSDATTNSFPAGSVSPANTVDGGAGTLSSPTGTQYQVTSKAFDLSRGYYDFQTPVETLGCGGDGSVQILYEGSFDGVNFYSATEAAGFGGLSYYPYIRFRAYIDVTGANPPCVDRIQLTFNYRELDRLLLEGGLVCATTQLNRSPPFKNILGDLFVLGIALLLGWGLRLERRKDDICRLDSSV